MKKIIVAAAAVAALALPVAASAGPSFGTPADGKCVAAGVKVLDGPTIALAATGGVTGSNAVPYVIQQHLNGVGFLTNAC